MWGMDETWSVEALEHTPSAWLSEVVLSALSWQGLTVPSGWRTWVHTAWRQGSVPDDLETVSLLSEVREEPFVLARTPEPSLAGPGETLLSGIPVGAEALVLLTPAYLADVSALPRPIVVTAGSAFPDDLPGALVPPPPVRQPVLLGTGVTADGAAAMVARPVVTSLVTSELGATTRRLLAPTGVDLLEQGGVLSLQPSQLALPWLRLAFSGSSRVPQEQVVSGPELPLLSLWLTRLSAVGTASDAEWEDALSLLALWEERYPTWEAVQADQKTARLLGELVPPQVAARADVNLFAAVVLSEVIAPSAPAAALKELLPRSRRRALQRTVAAHPSYHRWLSPHRPRVRPLPWR